MSILFIQGCATVNTTESGAIGLDRPQYFADGSREIMLELSAKSYDSLLNSALKYRALNVDPVATQRVVDIANRLIPFVKYFRPEAVNWAWETNVIEVNEPNATCRAGGKISVYSGLLTKWKPTDDELAAVIGHEIGHALRDHQAEKYSTRKRNSSVATGISSVLSIGLAVTTGVNLSNTLAQAGQLGAEGLANLPNSRELEHESDRIGLELMARAGYNPHAAVTLWSKVAEISKQQGDGSGSSFWSTHPSDHARVQDLSDWEPKVQVLYLAALEEQRKDEIKPLSKETSPSQATKAITKKSQKK